MTARLLVGDVRKRIKEIPDGSVDLVCSSPPFLALRKYGDGDEEMGSEPNPAAFIDALLELAGEFRRVLAPHGSIAIELGDTYSGSGGAGGDYNDDGLRAGQAKFKQRTDGGQYANHQGAGTKYNVAAERPVKESRGWPLAKSLAGVPEAYMLSLAYGWNVLDRGGDNSPAGRWRVRNVIVWARPNPPVGALGDKVRPATSYITVACVSDKRWFDLDAVRHESDYDRPNLKGNGSRGPGLVPPGQKHNSSDHTVNPAGAPPLDWWEDDDPTGHATLVMPTQAFRGSHYAVWPTTLAKRLIEMMCPLRVCVVCGEPSRRIVETESTGFGFRKSGENRHDQAVSTLSPDYATRTTMGWTDCGCEAEANGKGLQWRKGHVLDPFSGSATTISVAHGCGRDATGIELYEANAALSVDRMGMFLDVVA